MKIMNVEPENNYDIADLIRSLPELNSRILSQLILHLKRFYD